MLIVFRIGWLFSRIVHVSVTSLNLLADYVLQADSYYIALYLSRS